MVVRLHPITKPMYARHVRLPLLRPAISNCMCTTDPIVPSLSLRPPLPQPQSPPVAFSSGLLDLTIPPNEESTVILSGGPFDPANEEVDYSFVSANVNDEDFGDQPNQFPSSMKSAPAP
jgi:hypothetical protein